MIITIESIKELDPCEDGLANLETLYPNYNGTLKDFITLKGIPYDDKVWLACKLLDDKTLKEWALACAESVVHIYNKEYPNDNRINDCLVTVRRYLDGDASASELEEASSAVRSAVRSAAESAAWSAESAAWSVESAAWSAESAAVWSVARSAAKLAAESTSEFAKQQELNLKLLGELL